jgi:hypothetical protein
VPEHDRRLAPALAMTLAGFIGLVLAGSRVVYRLSAAA